jgi:hypothetical protein
MGYLTVDTGLQVMGWNSQIAYLLRNTAEYQQNTLPR